MLLSSHVAQKRTKKAKTTMKSAAHITMKAPAPQKRETHRDLLDETSTLANLLLFFVLMVAGNEFRLTSRTINLGFWTILPAMVLPIWLRFWRIWDAFLWSKLISLIPVAVVTLEFSRREGSINTQVLQLGWFSLLSINIAEAVALDLLSKEARSTWSPLNAISGVLLILTEIPRIYTIRISENPPHDLLWTIGVPWILAYTIWNWMLVLNNYPYAIGRHTAVLLAAIVLSLEDGWDVWFEARVYTLAFYALLRSTFYNRIRRLTDVKDPCPSIHGKRTLQVLALICNLILLGTLMVNKGWQQCSYYIDSDSNDKYSLLNNILNASLFQEWNLQYTILEQF